MVDCRGAGSRLHVSRLSLRNAQSGVLRGYEMFLPNEPRGQYSSLPQYTTECHIHVWACPGAPELAICAELAGFTRDPRTSVSLA